jgi:hypothetical protein
MSIRLLRTALAVVALLAASALVAPPAAAVPGLVTVMDTSPTGTGWLQGADPACPRGTKLLGGGADLLGGGHHVSIAGLNPLPGGTYDGSLWATAVEGAWGSAGPWSITAWAICGSGVTGYEIVEASSYPPPGGSVATATAYCPKGKKVIGAGGRQQGKAFVVLDSIHVPADLGHVTVETMYAEAVSSNVPLAVAYAVCVDPLPGQQRVSASSPYDSNNKLLSVACPAGTKLHGVAGGITGAGGQAYIDGLLPHGGGLTAAQIDAREDVTGFTGVWKVDVFAICAA